MFRLFEGGDLMLSTSTLAIITTFITILIFLRLVMGFFLNRDFAISSRLKRIQQHDEIYSADEPLSRPLLERMFLPILDRIDQLVRRMAPAGILQRVDDELVKAGRPWNMTAPQFMIFRLFLGLGLPVLLMMVMGSQLNIMFTIGIFGLGFLIPRFMIKRAVAQRKITVDRELPNALDLLTVSVEAGLGFDGAILKLVEKTNGPLTQEFRRMLQEIRIGKSRREALRELSERCGSEDVHTFVAAMIQADALGVSIGRVLRLQSQQMRMKRRQQAEERAMKAPIKMLIPMVLFIFPTVFVVLLGPGGLELIDQAKNLGMN
jgi:tight adherence protein C